MEKQIILRRGTGYALLLILSAILISCNSQKRTYKLPYGMLSGDLIFLADQSQVGEILAVLSDYTLYPEVIGQTEVVRNNENLLVMTVHIQCCDDLRLNQIESQLAGANWGIKDIRFRKETIEDSLNVGDIKR